jgi:hypothetical protein
VLLGGILAAERRASLPAVAGAIVGDRVGYLVGPALGAGGSSTARSAGGSNASSRTGPSATWRNGRRGGVPRPLHHRPAGVVSGTAGMARLDYRVFATWNAAGGTLWATGFVLPGYAAGTTPHRRRPAGVRRAAAGLRRSVGTGAGPPRVELLPFTLPTSTPRGRRAARPWPGCACETAGRAGQPGRGRGCRSSAPVEDRCGFPCGRRDSGGAAAPSCSSRSASGHRPHGVCRPDADARSPGRFTGTPPSTMTAGA